MIQNYRRHQYRCWGRSSAFKFPSSSPAYAALRPLGVGVLAALAALAAAARTEASAKLTTCLVALENWSIAAVVAATVDFYAVTVMS